MREHRPWLGPGEIIDTHVKRTSEEGVPAIGYAAVDAGDGVWKTERYYSPAVVKSIADESARKTSKIRTLETLNLELEVQYENAQKKLKKVTMCRDVLSVLLAISIFISAVFFYIGYTSETGTQNEPPAVSSNSGQESTPKTDEEKQQEKQQEKEQEPEPESSKPEKIEEPPVIDRPESGQLILSPVILPQATGGTSPLSVKTAGIYDYLIILTLRNSKTQIMSFYIRGGDTAEVDVPNGTYDMFYASGTGWTGRKTLFGSDTHYYKCEGTFSFFNGSGWSVELIEQINGNLETSPIDESAFPD